MAVLWFGFKHLHHETWILNVKKTNIIRSRVVQKSISGFRKPQSKTFENIGWKKMFERTKHIPTQPKRNHLHVAM